MNVLNVAFNYALFLFLEDDEAFTAPLVLSKYNLTWIILEPYWIPNQQNKNFLSKKITKRKFRKYQHL